MAELLVQEPEDEPALPDPEQAGPNAAESGIPVHQDHAGADDLHADRATQSFFVFFQR